MSPLPPIAGSAHVPKVGMATNVKQLRPILNCSFKILSKLQTYKKNSILAPGVGG